MVRGRRGATIALLALVALLPALERPVTAADEVTQLRPFEPFLDKTWKALVNPERELYDIALWERTLGGQAIRITHSVGDGAYGGETIIMWDRTQEALVYYYFTTAGFYTHGAMAFDDAGRLISRETVVGSEDGVTEVEATQEILGDGAMRVRTRMLRGGIWEERGEVVYRLAPSAVVVLPDVRP